MMTHRNKLLFCISAIGYFPFSEWIATQPIGTSFFLLGQLLYGGLMIAGIAVLPALIFSQFMPAKRLQALPWLLISVLFLASCVLGILLGRKTRMAGMKAMAQRSQPLIEAIKQFERDHTVPPQSLDQLVPSYLSAVPETGMMGYPKFRYQSGAKAMEAFRGNAWVLTVGTPRGILNFDQMLYFPGQNYPQFGYGGSIELVDDWAYVHE